MPLPVIFIFDVGKTNKKILLFDEEYQIVHEECIQITETVDEDNFPCEDIHALTDWVKSSFNRLLHDKRFQIKAVNFSGYGASFVYLSENLKIILPLYNYLKPYPEKLLEQFYNSYEGEENFATQTASPVLGNLNSGMQLYRLKYEKPEAFAKIKYALHLPQYLSFILSSNLCSEITSVGCHTNLWDFRQNQYHQWLEREGIKEKLAPIMQSDKIAGYINDSISVGVGLHDSSAALIPYLCTFDEEFILLSTGTWCISLNPFNDSPLTQVELQQDCLCYLTNEAKPVKASRLFAGHVHEQQVKKLAAHFNKPDNYFETVKYDTRNLPTEQLLKNTLPGISLEKIFDEPGPGDFKNYEEAYHYLMTIIVQHQIKSIQLIVNEKGIKKIFVDGGFSNNSIYMQLLAGAFPSAKISTGFSSNASALGAAIAFSKKKYREKVLKGLAKNIY